MNTQEKITKEQFDKLRNEFRSVVKTADIQQLAQLVVDAGMLVDNFRVDLGGTAAACPCQDVCSCQKQCTNECDNMCSCNNACGCQHQCPCQSVNNADLHMEDNWSRIQVLAKSFSVRMPK
jgi:hypothetical protein